MSVGAVAEGQLPERFGKYVLIAKLATGGMGEIFLARQSGMAGFEKIVVIKRLLPHLAEDEHFVTMLLDEARIAARLSHPNVCQVYDLGSVDGRYFIAMEHLEGVPCSTLLTRARRAQVHLDMGLVGSIMHQACEGLHHAHELTNASGELIGVVHRDVSPSNLFVTTPGLTKVLDFGVAKSQEAHQRTATGALKGKYSYMSPEQILAQPIDRRSDVFSLGVCLFELLTNRRLFAHDSEYKIFQAIAEDPIPTVRDFRPDVPDSIARVVEGALARDPADRWASADDMARALMVALAELGGPWPHAAIGQFVMESFPDDIVERRELVNAANSVVTPVPPAPADDEPATVSLRTPTGAAPTLAPAAVPAAASDSRTAINPLWWIMLALATLGAAAAVYVIAFRGPAPAAQSVVVVQQRDPSDLQPVAAPSEPSEQASDAAVGGGSGDGRPAAGDGRPAAAAPADAGRAPRPAQPMSVAKRFQRAVRAQQSALNKCQDLATNIDAKKLTLTWTLAPDGSVTHVALAPQRFASSPVGRCVLDVARATAFPGGTGQSGFAVDINVRKR